MPLQIRRGTTSQRLSITPLVSELVYDTTTKLVYVGDGVTAGGIAIDQDSSPDFPLGDLRDVVLTTVAEGDILRYDGDDWVNSELSLNSLDAVTVTAPANNDIIKFNGTNWVNSGLSFSTLPGVNLNSPEVNQVLKFNGTSWSNENEDSSFLVTAIDDLTDVVINELVTDQVLRYNGTNWVNDNESVSDLSDLETVVITSPIADQILKYDGANWVNELFAEAVADSFDSGIISYLFDEDSDSVVTSLDLTNYRGNASIHNITVVSDQVRTIQFDRFRGTEIERLSVNALDTLGRIEFRGFNGITSLVGSAITSTISAGSLGTGMPASINFDVNDTSNNLRQIFQINGSENRAQTIDAAFYINSNTYLTDPTRSQFACLQHHATADANNFTFVRGRGTGEAPTPIQSGDDIIDISFVGYNGVFYNNGASISVICDQNPTIGGFISSRFVFRTSNGTISAERLVIRSSGEVVANAGLLCAGGVFGYTDGTGGTETQLTSKATTVVLSKSTGEITLHDESLAGNSVVSFTLTNTVITSVDHIIVSHISGGSLGSYNLTAVAGTGAATIYLRNLTASALGEAIVLKFTVIKSTIV